MSRATVSRTCLTMGVLLLAALFTAPATGRAAADELCSEPECDRHCREVRVDYCGLCILDACKCYDCVN